MHYVLQFVGGMTIMVDERSWGALGARSDRFVNVQVVENNGGAYSATKRMFVNPDNIVFAEEIAG
jgi:hypothetical protein